MMMKIVLRLWIMGIQAGFLICIVLAVRACLKKYPKIYSCCLWIPVGFSVRYWQSFRRICCLCRRYRDMKKYYSMPWRPGRV